MGINTTLASLSKTASLNGPDGNTDPPSSLDDGLRYALSFIAQLRDGEGYTVALGMPVKTGENSTGGITIGYRTSLSKFTVADGATVYAKWPIDVSGKADTAGVADTATTAQDSNKLGGVLANGYARNFVPGNGSVGFYWNSGTSRLICNVNGAEFGGVWPISVPWVNISGRPTDLGSFTNGPAYQTSSDLSNYAVQRIDAVLQLGNVGASAMRANISGFGFVAWGVTPSDARLKKGIAPTAEDSLEKISRIDFRQFRFRQDATTVPIDDGRLHRLGVIAQELEAIDPDWVNNGGDWKAPDQQVLLYTALHAIQQQQVLISDLRDRIHSLEKA